MTWYDHRALYPDQAG